MTKKILVIGSGAREHAIVKSIVKSDKKPSVYCFSSSINPAIKNIVVDYFVGDILNVKNILDCLTNFLSISSTVKLDGAPLTTVIAFLPVFLSTWIPATPVLCLLEIIILEVSILSFLSLLIASLS